jgi:hypothetical protein
MFVKLWHALARLAANAAALADSLAEANEHFRQNLGPDAEPIPVEYQEPATARRKGGKP